MSDDAGRTSALWDFSGHVVTPIVERLVRDPSRAHAVELGYGDGRSLCPAASYFGTVTGVAIDPADDASLANSKIENCPGTNISLADSADIRRLPFDDATIDFIYSLRGVVRLPDLHSFETLVKEAARTLKPGGVAILWFGRLSRLPFAPPGAGWWRGWARRQSPFDPGQEVLHIRMFHARRAVMRAGMKAVALSTPLHPDTSWRLLRGGPVSYVTARKPLK